MTVPEQTGHNHAQSKDTDERVHDNTAPVQIMRVWLSEKGALILAIVLVAIISAYALARAEAANDRAQLAEREARLAQYDAQLMRTKAAAAGIEIDDHAQEKHK